VLACLVCASLVAACASPATQTPVLTAASAAASPGPPVGATPSASLAAGPSPSAAPAGPPAIAWIPEAGNRAALRDPAGAGSLSDVIPIGDGLLAVGADTHGTTIWRGTAAGTWTRLDTDRFALADEVGLRPTSHGIVASGSQETGDHGVTYSAIWTSTDGSAWSPPVVVGDEFRRITRVVELAGRLVALVSGNGAPTNLVSSIDGRTWSRTPAFGPLASSAPSDVMVAGTRLVAIGVGEGDTAAAWYSDDGGASWQAADLPPGGPGSTMTSVTLGPDGLVAVGSVAGMSDVAVPAIWSSADGTTWALVARGAGPGRFAGVAHGDDGWVAAGSNDVGGGQGLPDSAPRVGLTAVSADGRDWIFLEPTKGTQFSSVVATTGGWVAAGQRGGDAMLWTSGNATARFTGGWPAIPPLACPPASGPIDLAALLTIPAEKRLACLGRTEVTFRAWVVPQGGRGGTCGGPPALIWLTCTMSVPADQVAAYRALTGPTLGVIPRPGAAIPASWGGLLPPGTWVQVTGHLDDPAAAGCGSAFSAGFSKGGIDTPAKFVTWCRSQFVATRVATVP
jgi:hypothetical protein